MMAELPRPSRTKLITDGSEQSITTPAGKRERLYVLIEDYHKSLSNIDLKQLTQEEGQAGWIAEQTQFVKLLRRKLSRYDEHSQCQKHGRLLTACESVLRKLDGTEPARLQSPSNLDNESSIEAVSPVRPKPKHTVARSIDKLKETITAKQKLLQRNYQSQHDKNRQLAVKVRHQQSHIDQLTKHLREAEHQLHMARQRLLQHNSNTNSRQNKQILQLIKQNEEKDAAIENLQKEVENLKGQLNLFSEQKHRQRYNQQEMYALMEANLQLKTANNMLQMQIDKLSRTVSELETEMKDLADKSQDRYVMGHLQQENARLREENHQLEHRIEQVAREIEKLSVSEKQLTTIKNQNEQLRRHLVYKNKNSELLEAQLHELQQKVLQLDQGNLQAVQSLKQARQEIRDLQQRCDLYKQKYFRLKQNLPEQGRTSRQTHRQSQVSCHGTSTCGGNDLSTSRLASRPNQQSKKLRVLEDLKSLVRSHRCQLEKLR